MPRDAGNGRDKAGGLVTVMMLLRYAVQALEDK
jgi:hypothetical protein